MSKSKIAIAVGAALAVLLGLMLGVLFGAGGTRTPAGNGAPVAVTREPDPGLQVVVGPPGKTAVNAPKLPPILAPTRRAGSEAATAASETSPAAPASDAIGDDRATPTLRPGPRAVQPAPSSFDEEADEEDDPPPLRPAPPLDGDDARREDGPPLPPLPPPPG